MKKLFLLVAAMFAAVSFSACSDNDESGDDGNLARPALPKPNDVCSCMDDPLFKDYCYAHFDINYDGKISKAEAEAVKTMDFNDSDWKRLKSLKGIGYFVNLEKLDCSDTYLTEVDLSQNKELISIKFCKCKSLKYIILPNAITSIKDSAFDYCESLASITIPDNVTSIGKQAFCYCKSLVSITIPDNVTSIGDQAFWGCENLQSFKGKFASSDSRCLIMDDGTLVAFAPAGLTEYTIPNGVFSIGGGMFNSPNNLTNITIPDSVTSIEVCALSSYSLKEIYCKPNTPPSLILDYPFPYIGIYSWTKIYVPRASVYTYKTATGWRYYDNQIVGYDFNNIKKTAI